MKKLIKIVVVLFSVALLAACNNTPQKKTNVTKKTPAVTKVVNDSITHAADTVTSSTPDSLLIVPEHKNTGDSTK